MAFQQLQTAAVRVFHLTNPTDRDLAKVQNDFPLHPHDAEAILGVAPTSQAEHFGTTIILRLPWVQYDQAANDLVTYELDLLWREHNLVIATKGEVDGLQSTLDDVVADASGQHYTSPLEVVAELLWRMTSQAVTSTRAFTQSLAPTVQDHDAEHWQRTSRQTAEALEQAVAWVPAETTESVRLRLKLIVHQLNHLNRVLEEQPRQATRRITVPTLALPKLARGYVMVSAVIILLVLVATAG